MPQANADFAGAGVLGRPEIGSFTAARNARSQAVMRRVGMHHEPEWEFDHPAVPEGHRCDRTSSTGCAPLIGAAGTADAESRQRIGR